MACLLLFCALAAPLAACDGWRSEEEREMASEALRQAEEAMASDPVEGCDYEDPLCYFRPHRGANGRVAHEVVEAKVRATRLDGDTGEVAIDARLRNHNGDGTAETTPDRPVLVMEKRDGEWVAVGIHVPL